MRNERHLNQLRNEKRHEESAERLTPVKASVAARDIDTILTLLDRAAKGLPGQRVVSVVGDERSDVSAFLNDVTRVAETHHAGDDVVSIAAIQCAPAGRAFEGVSRIARALASCASPILRQSISELLDDPHVAATYPSPSAYFRTIARWFVRSSAERPAMIVVADADRIDAESLEILAMVVGGAGDGSSAESRGFRGVVLFGAPTDGAVGSRDRGCFRSQVAAWISAEVAVSIEARPLDRASIATFLQSAPVLDTVWEKTKGRHGKLAELFGANSEPVESLSRQRLGSLDAKAMDLLTGIALFGRACPLAMLETLGVDLAVVAELLRDRFVGGDHAIDFIRADDRDEVLASANEDRTRSWHLEFALLLAEDASTAGQAAHHFVRAGRFDDAERCALRACDGLERQHAFGTALQTVVDVIDAGWRSPELLDRAIRYAGARGEYNLALRFAAKRKAVAKTALDAVPALREAVTFLTHLGRYGAARGVIRGVKRRNGVLAADLRLDFDALEAELLFLQGDLAGASELATRSREEAAQSDALPVCVAIRLDNVLGKIAWQRGRYDEALSRFQVNLLRAEETGDTSEKIRALTNLATVQIQRQNYFKAEDLLKTAIREAQATGDSTRLAAALVNLAALYHRTWDYGRAIDSYERAISLLRRVDRRLFFARALCNYADLLTFLGDRPRATRLAEEAVATARGAGDKHVLAISLGYLGGAQMTSLAAEAEENLRAAIRLADETQSHRQSLLFKARLLELMVSLGRDVVARELLAEISAAATACAENDAPEITIWKSLFAGALCDSVAERQACGERAVKVAEATNDRELLLRAYRLLGSMARLEGDWEASERYALSAESLVAKMRAEIPESILRRFDQAHNVDQLAEDVRTARLLRETSGARTGETGRSGVHATSARSERMVAESPVMQQVTRLISRVAPTDTTVLVVGESGTGKELVAEALHRQSARRERPFVSINCSALVETLLLSELFGHEKGAFTGAVARGKGKFEAADGGTLFLDEIGDISVATQVALLRVLQEREFHRVGGVVPVRVDVRVVCATNRNLEAMVEAGRFREDLYYRLNCVTIALPPLRERRDDIPRLANMFLAKCAADARRPGLHFSNDALDGLCRFGWPGNVRQLENAVRSVAILSDGDEISLVDVRAWHGSSPSTPTTTGADRATSVSRVGAFDPPIGVAGLSERVLRSELSLDDMRHELEMTCIARALQETDWNITHAATLLKMKRPRLSQIVKANLETLRSLQVGNA
ncbi:MAG: sigma 54-interacting transcriptional regulator [Deltaproteobacteria bacterium]|nr:sigma 54-interacting transcriptional regulator [Deltaproteobacteria bacterium]